MPSNVSRRGGFAKLRFTAALLLLLAGGAVLWLVSSPGWAEPDPQLSPYVETAPRWPIVFTSRTEPASFRAAADEGEAFTYPGQPLWQAREGRLRLLTPRGEVAELTWGKKLPDGSTIIDVMSPSVSPDGKKVVFAGRKPPPDPGHFRLYEIGVDGTGLRQLTGGPEDPGAARLPPMRYAKDGETLLSDEVRKRVDYDDVDPVYAPGGHIVFASSRTPDLGRGHSRRSTTLWIMREDGSDKKPLSSNRNNDRWPWIADNGYVVFSLWSRNREVISADWKSIEPYREGTPTATPPTDAWLGAHIEPNADFFGSVIKVPQPVWRPRPMPGSRYAFMTRFEGPSDPDPLKGLTVAMAPSGVIAHAPSSLAEGSLLPRPDTPLVVRGPSIDFKGRTLRLATPSPCPPDQMLLAAATPSAKQEWEPGRFGLYAARSDWRTDVHEVSAEAIELTPLFDDPKFVDAEPVAVYPREIAYEFLPLEDRDGQATIPLAGGRTYEGPTGHVENSALYRENNGDAPGQTSDTGESPIYSAPPDDLIEKIRVYASYRDRFDDPEQPHIDGAWELLLESPVENGAFRFRLPPGIPTVLAGFDADGKVAQWIGKGKDSSGNQGKFFAFAGDHYSGARPGFPHFCTGCHTGHSGTPTLRLKSR